MKLLLVFVGLAIVGSMIQALIPKHEPTATELADKKSADHRVAVAQIAAQSVKNSLNDPSSVQFIRILANENGTLVCLQYRAKNGFGALMPAQTVISDGRVKRAHNAWRKNCTVELHDVTDVSKYLR